MSCPKVIYNWIEDREIVHSVGTGDNVRVPVLVLTKVLTILIRY